MMSVFILTNYKQKLNMENTHEEALNYVKRLEIVENRWNEAEVATAMMSYAEKVKNKNYIIPNVSHSAFRNIAEEFRNWQMQWELFDKQEITKKPPHLDEFITTLEQKYVAGFKHCG